MDLLARREHSRLELHEKLSRRFAGCQELIQSETEKLTAEGLQSDARLAEAYVRARSNRGQGPRKIRMELRQKGISDDLILSAFNECETDWFELAAMASLKKFGAEPATDMKERARRGRFLQQRGFDFEHISEADRLVQHLADDTD